jgi:signal transduction histidine kinase/ActR/RegA family two-component response regulator
MQAATHDLHLLASAGAVRAGYHVHDWTASPVGPPEAWPASLRHAASLILESEFPMYLAWGPHLTFLYNAAFAPLLDGRAPGVLGMPLAEVWPALWPGMKPLFERAMAGHAIYGEDVPTPVYRHGKTFPGWFTLAYSPVRDDDGAVRGVLCVTSETTPRVQLERRHAVQLQVVDSLRRLHHPSDIIECACTVLGKHLELEHACYVEADEPEGGFEVMYDWARDQRSTPLAGKVARLDDFGPQALALLRTGTPLAVQDAALDPRLPKRGERYAAAGARSILVVPRVRRGQLQAALVGYARLPRDWDEESQRLAADIAERSWEALDRVRAEQALRDAVARQTTLLDMNEFRLELADLLRRLDEPGQIFLQTGAMLGRFLQASRVLYGDYDADKHIVTFHSNYTDGMTSELSGTFPTALFGNANFAALAQGTLVVNDMQQDPRTGGPDIWPNYAALQIRSSVVVPLNRNGALTSCMFINDNLPRIWNADIVRLIEDVAERVWTAVERVRAEEALRLADRRKDEFLAMLAHELRNPLAPISAAAQLLNMGVPDGARVARTSAIIARQVTHMTGLIDDLLDVSRVTRGLVVLARDEVDLRRIINDAVEQVRPLIEARRHQLTVHLSAAPMFVEGDTKRLVQVLANLLNNAAKYTPEGGRLAIWLGATAEQVLISVSDSGIGIAADLLPTVFDLFSQAERTPDRAQGGLGLGLALVKSLVELHSGMVTVASEGRNMGSEFTVRLPRLHAPAHAQAPAASADTAAPSQAHGLKLMLVDDNVDAAQTLGLLLESGGHAVTVAHSPFDALARAAQQAFDVYLLDIGLPGMNGYELARRLRGLPNGDRATLVAITGYGQQSDQAEAVAAGFDRYFVKPVEPASLFELLARVAAQ